MSEIISEPVQPNPDPLSSDTIIPPAPQLAQNSRRRSLPMGGILGLIVILVLLGAGAGFYFWQGQSWQGQAAQQNRQIAALNDELGALKVKTAALAAQQAHPPAQAPARLSAADAAKIDGLQQNVSALAATIATDHATIASLRSSMQSQLGTLGSKLNDLQSGLGAMPALAAQAQRLDRIAAASIALQNGQPLGTIPGAPSALAQYADKAPPTEAELNREFPAAARQAAAAGGDVQATGSYWHRLRMRVAGLVTLQHRGQVLVGSRVSGVLTAAQNDLDDGDLPTAVTTLQALSPPAKAAMGDWLDQANGLLAARRAMAAQASASPPSDHQSFDSQSPADAPEQK